ncbi:MAG: methyltransferase domain-containing protein [Chloroflexi bacterium]|nr:methyltransferase domain-containing protein [Chloroflexota bacterium]
MTTAAFADAHLKQGTHIDPLAPGYRPPTPSEMAQAWKASLPSREFTVYREALLLPGIDDHRTAILDDLSTYYQLSPDECVARCINWEAWSVEEWFSGDRSTLEGMRAFYNSTQSWSFDLSWYAYLQAVGAIYPTSVIAARALRPPAEAPRCLDFGSGIGDLAQLLSALGYTVDLADVSRPLLEFARWRLERRGQRAGYLDLNDVSLPADTYDAVMAKDVLVHVPHFAETVRELHRALRPNGLMIASFDTRPPSPENSWHLYSDDTVLRRTVQDIGFEQVGSMDGHLFVYQRVDADSPAHLLRRGRNALMLGPQRRIVRQLKPLAKRLLRA